MTPLHITTPLLRHARLSAALGKNIVLKMENLQPSGSFTLIVVCGGIGVDLAKLEAWKNHFER